MSGRAELVRALAVVCEPPGPGLAGVVDALGLPGRPRPEDYVDLFLLQAYPYASVYLGPEGMMGGEARDRAAGFWRALGFVPPSEPDHLAALLGLYAVLIEAERDEPDPARRALRRASRRALLWEHLLSWCPAYLDKVAEVASPSYAAWSTLLRATLLDEAERVGRQVELPLGLRLARELPSAEASGDEWVAALLAPARSGVIVTRADLGKGSTLLGLGVRMGERSRMLRSMLEVDPGGTIAWLVDAADDAAGRHAALEPALGPVATHWRDRAAATSAALHASSVAA